MPSRRLHAALPPFLIGAGFIGAVLLIVALRHKAWAISDIISLLTGAFTAAGLFAIFLQVRTAEEDAKERENQRALEMAVRADQLHMEFNTESMRESRDLAYFYLKSLRDRDLLKSFAESWLHERENPNFPISKSNETDKAVWAVSVMVAFYVRLASHVKFYDDRVKHLSAEDLARLIGPFFWDYWAEAGMKALVHECENLEEGSPFGRPYFINPLRELERFSNRAKGINLGTQQEAVGHQQDKRSGDLAA